MNYINACDLMFYEGKHRYTLAATGIKFNDKLFASREAAKKVMYKFMDSNGIRLKEKWHDGHYVTYVCENGVRFYINRI